jgi:quercetin dioxygenase-like cupin family protein
MGKFIKKAEEFQWEAHPFLKGVEFKYLLSKRIDGVDVTITFVKVKQGVDIEAHVHETQDDIIYCLEGNMKVWIEGEGDFHLEPRMMIRIPKGVKHRPYGHSEGFLAIDIFIPAII